MHSYGCFTRKFYKTASGVISSCGKSKPKLVGGMGKINFGKQYRQGNKVYDLDEIAMCLTAPTRWKRRGGNSYLYLVKIKKQGMKL